MSRESRFIVTLVLLVTLVPSISFMEFAAVVIDVKYITHIITVVPVKTGKVPGRKTQSQLATDAIPVITGVIPGLVIDIKTRRQPFV